MNSLSSVELLIGILAGLITGMIILVALQVRNTVAVNRLAAPVYDFVLHEAEQEAKKILEQAKKEAEQIRTEAETERDALLATYTKRVETLHQNFSEQLTAHTDNMEKTLDSTFEKSLATWQTVGAKMQEQITKAEKQVTNRFTALETSLQQAEEKISAQAKTAITQFEQELTKTATILKEKLEAHDATITTKVDEHTKDALKAIDDALLAYRTSREHILDAHMAQIIEAVAADVLHKQLTLDEHAELAKQALMEAKQKHIL